MAITRLSQTCWHEAATTRAPPCPAWVGAARKGEETIQAVTPGYAANVFIDSLTALFGKSGFTDYATE